ncbi:MAG: hypothetical protein JNL58_14230 [Planctomyces sp.]|nr:hypothetical protein [Planctomyces sp.]
MPEPHRIRLAGPWQIQVRGSRMPDEMSLKDIPLIAALESRKWQVPIQSADVVAELKPMDWGLPALKSQHLQIEAVRGFHCPNGLSESSQVVLDVQFQETIGQVRLNGNSLKLLEDSPTRRRFDVTHCLPHGFNRLEVSLFEIAENAPNRGISELTAVVLEIFEHS